MSLVSRAVLLTLTGLALLVPAAPAGPAAQRTIALPGEFRPEGIAAGKGASFFVGSIPSASVFRGSFKTGKGSVLVPPHAGRAHIGLKVDKRHNRLYVAGGASKGIYVYDSETGAEVASYPLPASQFINDVVLTRRAAYFTDSRRPVLYRVGIGRSGAPGALTTVQITGDLEYEEGNNANGVETLRGSATLVTVQSNTGKLFRLNARNGRTREIALDEPVTNGDGILRRGRTLYVVRNRDNRIAVVKLAKSRKRGKVRRLITNRNFDVPTTIAPYKKYLYAVNARFDRPDDSDADIVRVRSGR